MKRLLTILGTVALLLATTTTASADPITCPPGQHSEKVDNVWTCVNNGGNTSNADETRNPSD